MDNIFTSIYPRKQVIWVWHCQVWMNLLQRKC